MATGIPKKPARAGGAPRKGNGEFRLEYEGKADRAEVLSHPPGDYRPVRHGDTQSANRLYFADNLPVLAALLRDRDVAGRVKLVYIDPPYATETAFHSRDLTHAYDDILSGARYLEALRRRLIMLRELLADDGSLYLHLDGKMVFHAKLVLDEVFGAAQYRNCITRKKCNPKNYTKKAYGNVSDFILFYAKTANTTWNRPTEAWTDRSAREYRFIEEGTGRRYMKVPVHAPGTRRGETGLPWRGKEPPPGKHWQYPPRALDELDARGEIAWSPSGNPRRKVYLDASPGPGVQDIWLEMRDAHNQNIRITGYPTEKNPDLVRRIVEASSNPGDLVLDCYSGSGTTLAVADELGRRWVGIDSAQAAIEATVDRLLYGMRPMGNFGDLERETGSLFDDTDAEHPARVALPAVARKSEFDLYFERGSEAAHGDVVRRWHGKKAM